MEGVQPEHEVDFRDAKIVHLAKKSRSLTVALDSEKTKNRKLTKQVDDLKRDVTTLQTQLDLVSSPAARAAAMKAAAPAAGGGAGRGRRRRGRAEQARAGPRAAGDG